MIYYPLLSLYWVDWSLLRYQKQGNPFSFDFNNGLMTDCDMSWLYVILLQHDTIAFTCYWYLGLSEVGLKIVNKVPYCFGTQILNTSSNKQHSLKDYIRPNYNNGISFVLTLLIIEIISQNFLANIMHNKIGKLQHIKYFAFNWSVTLHRQYICVIVWHF